MKTGIYVRVSTEEQAQEGFSIRAQEQKLRDYARIKEWIVHDVYIDEGISGKNVSERPAVNGLIKDIEKGKVRNVLVYKIDRLTRSTRDLINFVELFDEYGCTFNSLSESIDTETASGRMFLKIIGIFAEFERENIIERTKLGFERKVKEGYTLSARVPSYGYERKDGEKIQQINEEEAQIVREIFSMYLYNHLSYLEIARVLNLRKIPTKEKSVWHSRTVKNVLTNCNYVGNVRYATKDEKRHFETTGRHEPIISMEMYEETQALIAKMSTKNYTKRPKEAHYFAGILFCAKCGDNLVTHGNYSKNKPVEWGTYRCRNRYNSEKKCDAMNVSHYRFPKLFR
jgi:site-specific DNA recombinase